MNTEQKNLMHQRVFKALDKHFTWSNDAIVGLVLQMLELREEQIWDDFVKVIKAHTESVEDRRKTDLYAEGIYQNIGRLWWEFNKVMGKDVEVVWSEEAVEQYLQMAKEQG